MRFDQVGRQTTGLLTELRADDVGGHFVVIVDTVLRATRTWAIDSSAKFGWCRARRHVEGKSVRWCHASPGEGPEWRSAADIGKPLAETVRYLLLTLTIFWYRQHQEGRSKNAEE